jgi:transposase
MRINRNKIITLVIVKTAYKLRAYPSMEQKAILNSQRYLCKELYNHPLEKAKQRFQDTGRTSTKYDIAL